MSTKQKLVKKRTSLVTRVGNGVRRAIRNNPTNLNRRVIAEVINRSAVATKSEELRKIAALVSGLLKGYLDGEDDELLTEMSREKGCFILHETEEILF